MSVVSDPISDFLTRIRNALKAGFDSVDLPSSKIKIGLANILKKRGYIKNYKSIDDSKQGLLRIYLKYTKNKPTIEGMVRVSKPSGRVYYKSSEVPYVRNGIGMLVLSTASGIIADDEARKLNVGGEAICKVW